MTNLKENQKVGELYKLISERGLYVNTNYDIFNGPVEYVDFGVGQYKLPLLQTNTKAYSSPLLFATLTSLLKHGTMLVTGAPGIGKTTGMEFAGHFFTDTKLDEILAAEILGNPNLTEEKVIASYDTAKLLQGIREVLPTMFLKCPVKIWDEINRTPPDLLSAAMKLVDTGKAVYGGKLLESPKGPLFATANYADDGTFQITPPMLDRFDVAVMVTSPQPWDLRQIRARGDEKLNADLEDLLSIPPELKLNHDQIRKEIDSLEEDKDKGVMSFADFLYASLRFSEVASDYLARATKGNAWQLNQDSAESGHYIEHSSTYTLNELSVRTVRAIQRYAKAFAWFNGKDKVSLQETKAIVPYVLWHKIQPTNKALEESPKYANDRIDFVSKLVEKIENEYNEFSSDPPPEYGAALGIVRSGEALGKELSMEDIRKVTGNAIEKLGEIDKVWALILATHLVSEYNERFKGK